MKYHFVALLLVLAALGLGARNLFENLQSMKRYLVAMLFVIMGTGLLSLCEILASVEQENSPSNETYFCLFVAPWCALMLVADLMLLKHKSLKAGNRFIGLLSIGVIGPPIIYMLINSK